MFGMRNPVKQILLVGADCSIPHPQTQVVAVLKSTGLSWLIHIESTGKQRVCELENGPVEIVDLPIKNADFT